VFLILETVTKRQGSAKEGEGGEKNVIDGTIK
jgi:hypothetical protein